MTAAQQHWLPPPDNRMDHTPAGSPSTLRGSHLGIQQPHRDTKTSFYLQTHLTERTVQRGSWTRAALVVALAAIMAVPTGMRAQSDQRVEQDSAYSLSRSGLAHGVEAVQQSIPQASGPGFVNWTLCMKNNTLLSGNAACFGGFGPRAAVWDSMNGDIYVTNEDSGNVSVISGSTNRAVATISLGTTVFGVTYDSRSGDIYVTDSGSNKVSVISGRTNTVVATIPVGSDPEGAVYDSANGDVYITNVESNTVSVTSGANYTVVATIPVGSEPGDAAYDSGNGEIYIADVNCVASPCGQGYLSVVSGSTNRVVANIDVGPAPGGVAFDSGNGDIYVTSGLSDYVSAIAGNTNRIVTNISVGNDSDGVAYDSGNGDIYVTNGLSDYVSVISGSTNWAEVAIQVGAFPIGAAYDNQSGNVYIINDASGSVSIITPGNPNSPGNSGNPSGGSFPWLYIGVGGIVAMVAVAIWVLLLRKWRESPVSSPPASAQPA